MVLGLLIVICSVNFCSNLVVFNAQVENAITALNKSFPADGLLPIYVSPDSGTPSYATITFGAMGDR